MPKTKEKVRLSVRVQMLLYRALFLKSIEVLKKTQKLISPSSDTSGNLRGSLSIAISRFNVQDKEIQSGEMAESIIEMLVGPEWRDNES